MDQRHAELNYYHQLFIRPYHTNVSAPLTPLQVSEAFDLPLCYKIDTVSYIRYIPLNFNHQPHRCSKTLLPALAMEAAPTSGDRPFSSMEEDFAHWLWFIARSWRQWMYECPDLWDVLKDASTLGDTRAQVEEVDVKTRSKLWSTSARWLSHSYMLPQCSRRRDSVAPAAMDNLKALPWTHTQARANKKKEKKKESQYKTQINIYIFSGCHL